MASIPTSPILITADDREKDGGVIQSLRAFPEVSVHIRRLPLGDYLVADRVLFERKSWGDFCASIIDGRLFRQAAQLAHQQKRAALIIEGTAADAARSGITREAVQGALIAVSVFYGIPILRSRNAEETARLILYTGRQNRSIKSLSLPRSGRRPRGKRKQQLYILQGLPGIGPVRAERLLRQFGNLASVFNASIEALRQVPGIGPREAQKLLHILKDEPSPYGEQDVTL